MSANMHIFENPSALAEALADDVGARLAAAIAARGTASLAVSGGSTPKAFFRSLSRRELDWSKVTVTLVDERFVPPENDRSNHRLVADNLLKDGAAEARFVPLYQAAETAEAAAAIASGRTASLGAPPRCRGARHGNGRPYGLVLPRGGRALKRRSTPRRHAA